MTPQKWYRIDPSGTGLKTARERVDLLSCSADMGELNAEPYLLWKEEGCSLGDGFAGYLSACLCLQHFGVVFVALLMYLKCTEIRLTLVCACLLRADCSSLEEQSPVPLLPAASHAWPVEMRRSRPASQREISWKVNLDNARLPALFSPA